MKQFPALICLLITGMIFTGCGKDTGTKRQLQDLNDSIGRIYAPDKRVAIYEMELLVKNKEVVISGETDQPGARDALHGLLREQGFEVTDRSILLPDSTCGNYRHALVNNSVANIRSKPGHSAELATQALLGTCLKLLRISGDFYLVQTPDKYISWVDHGGVTLMDEEAYAQWNRLPKLIYTNVAGFVFGSPDDALSKVGDIVLGSTLGVTGELNSFYQVVYPDGRIGYVRKEECEMYSTWAQNLQASGALVELYARDLMGVPYLWGGTSVKGMDCSGFTKTVYLMNGLVIPRDASQQIMAGKDVDPDLSFENLKKGDLLFFGSRATDSTRQKVTHVGIWLGNDSKEFIHASGRVKIGSISSSAPNFDAANKNRYLGSRRYLGEKDALILQLKEMIREEALLD